MVITVLKKGKSSVVLAVAATMDIMFKIVGSYTVENVESFASGSRLPFHEGLSKSKIK